MSSCEKAIAFLLDGVRVWFLPKSKICTTSNQYLCSNIEILFHVLVICISILKTIYFGHYTHPVMYIYGYGHLKMLLWINIWFKFKIYMCSDILLNTGNVLRCIRPQWGRIQHNAFRSGIHRYNLHGPWGRASYTCQFHLGMSHVVCAPNGDAYNATHSQVEITSVTYTPRRACKLHLWLPLGNVLRCIRPHRGLTQRKTFRDQFDN